MNLVNHLGPRLWSFLKSFWLSKPPSSLLVVTVVESMPKPIIVPKGRIVFCTQMQTDWKLGPQAAAEKVCSQALSRVKLGDGPFTHSFCNRPWCVATGGKEGASAPTKKCFFLCYSSVGLINTSPFVSPSQVIQGPVPQQSQKLGTPDMCTSSF